MENLEQNEATEAEPLPLHTVTPLSKYLAMVLFVILPFLGGWIGYTYAPEKVVEVERIVAIETKTTEKPDTEQAIPVPQAVSVILAKESEWPSLATHYDYSGTTSIPWYGETVSYPDIGSLNKTNPRQAFDVCNVRHEGDYDEDFVQKIQDGLSWSIGSQYNGMTYEGFECIGTDKEPWEQIVRFVFSGDFDARGITSYGAGPERFYISGESADKFDFLPITERQERLAPADTSSIWNMYAYGQNSSGIEMTISSNFLYYSIYPREVFSYAETLNSNAELEHDVPFESFEFTILGYELHKVITEPIDWDNY